MDDLKPNSDLNPGEHLTEVARREDALVTEIKQKLPDFVAYCNSPIDVIVLQQDAFAGDYQDSELRLLGMAIKCAGLNGKEVRIIGNNRETL